MKDITPAERLLKLLFYLNFPFGRTLAECMETIGISRATFFEYKNKLTRLGFCIDCDKSVYYLNIEKSESEWFTKLFHLSDEDTFLIGKAISKLDIALPKELSLKQRLLKIFDTDLYSEYVKRMPCNAVIARLIEAMNSSKQAMLIDYHSGNSNTVQNRLVEPFKISDSFNLVWCYDVEKQCNRQFKISRISSVQITPFDIENKSKYKSMPTDVFRNTGMLNKSVELNMSLRASNLLIEEYPLAEQYLTELKHNRFSLKCDVSKYEGPCRFVLGLWDDVEIIGDLEFKRFVNKRLKKMCYV